MSEPTLAARLAELDAAAKQLWAWGWYDLAEACDTEGRAHAATMPDARKI